MATPASVLLFSLVMGSLTSGLMAHIYGLRYLGTTGIYATV